MPQLVDSYMNLIFILVARTALNSDSVKKVVLDLTSSLANTFATIYADNYFSSPRLALTLLERNIYFTGVVKPNRKGMPAFTDDKTMKRGQYQIFECDQKQTHGCCQMGGQQISSYYHN